MFIRKLFKIKDKAKWLFLELVVVFIGVYLAFLFQSYNENQKIDREKEKVYSALKFELEYFRIVLPGRASYMRTELTNWRALQRKGEYPDFSLWVFLEPQYGYEIIEYAMNLENTDVIDFKLYNSLVSVFTNIKLIEHGEAEMMDMSQRYLAIPQALSKNSDTYRKMSAENKLNFSRFLLFSSSRAENLVDLADKSKGCLNVLNELMDPELRKEVEEGLIRTRIEDFASNVEEAKEVVKSYFPDFTDREIEKIYNEVID